MSGLALTATALAAMVVGCAAVGAVAQVAQAHARVDASADLAALAVASRSARGEPTDAACRAATVRCPSSCHKCATARREAAADRDAAAEAELAEDEAAEAENLAIATRRVR